MGLDRTLGKGFLIQLTLITIIYTRGRMNDNPIASRVFKVGTTVLLGSEYSGALPIFVDLRFSETSSTNVGLEVQHLTYV